MIREMFITDYEDVISLWKRTEGIGLSEADDKDNIEKFLVRNDGLSYVFIIDYVIVGAVLCGHDGRRGYIHHLAVDSKYRDNKIGSILLAHSLGKLGALGIGKCHLFVFKENECGKGFWKHSGWSLREDLLVFSKSL